MDRLVVILVVLVFSQTLAGQMLPREIKGYLDSRYKGWKLSPSEEACGPETNNGVISSDFDGNKSKDYAVKLVRGRRGYFIAFMKIGAKFQPHVLDSTTAVDINARGILVWKKGERYETGDQTVLPRFDSPADFRCESDVGGIHVFKRGKFVGY